MDLTSKQQASIEKAVEKGYNQFSRDKKEQALAYLEWSENQFIMDFPKIIRGSLLTYISQEILKEIESW